MKTRFKTMAALLKRASWLLAILGSLVSTLCAGCATTGYLGDRARDAADMFTCSRGDGFGFKVRAGIVQLGYLDTMDISGVRGGERFFDAHQNWEEWRLIGGGECFAGGRVRTQEQRRKGTIAHERGKTYSASGLLCISIPSYERRVCPTQPLSYLTQVEMVIGAARTIRLGVNFAEALDFALGWTTLDIFSDDLERKERKSNRAGD